MVEGLAGIVESGARAFPSVDPIDNEEDPMTRNAPLSRIARRTGAAYLGVVFCGIFAELFVRGSLVEAGDATATASAIAAAPASFALGIFADLLMVLLDVGVAYGLYRLLSPVHRPLAIAATAFRLLQASILAANLLHLVGALRLAGDPALPPEVLAAVETHALVYDIGLIPFGLACLVLGPLLRRAGGPRWIALALTATGLVYLIGSFGAVFAPGLSAAIDPLYALAIVAEPAVAIWLIVRARRWEARPSREPSGAVLALG